MIQYTVHFTRYRDGDRRRSARETFLAKDFAGAADFAATMLRALRIADPAAEFDVESLAAEGFRSRETCVVGFQTEDEFHGTTTVYVQERTDGVHREFTVYQDTDCEVAIATIEAPFGDDPERARQWFEHNHCRPAKWRPAYAARLSMTGARTKVAGTVDVHVVGITAEGQPMLARLDWSKADRLDVYDRPEPPSTRLAQFSPPADLDGPGRKAWFEAECVAGNWNPVYPV